MDLSKLTGALLNSDSIKGLSNITGASGSDVTSVLSQALPALLNGAKDQAQNSSTAQSFANALASHKKDDTSDVGKFLGGIDLTDGAKIIGHLLGSGKDNLVQNISENTGVSNEKTSGILSAAAPLLMSLLGQETENDTDSGLGNILGSVLDNVDVGSLLTGLLTGSNEDDKKPVSQSGSGILGKVIGGLFNK